MNSIEQFGRQHSDAAITDSSPKISCVTSWVRKMVSPTNRKIKTQTELQQQELIERLARELSNLRITTGQLICNHSRSFEKCSLSNVVDEWIMEMGEMGETEWITGAHALIHYLRMSQASSAQSVIDKLSPPEQLYRENKWIYRSQQGRRGKANTPAKFQRASALLLSELLKGSNVLSDRNCHTMFSQCNHTNDRRTLEPAGRAIPATRRLLQTD